jgi:cellulose synthase/poly-beta-1,6-N-acetylglucosamine synthase-like glycosyltransferase
MERATAVGGFDKEMEVNLLERNISIGYARKAIVLDEKVQQSEVFVNQRRRWLSAQLVYFRKNIAKSLQLLFLKGNVDFFDKIIQFVLPPRMIALGMSVIFFGAFALLWLLQVAEIQIFTIAWTAILVVNILAILLSIPAAMYNKKMLKALLSLPSGFLYMALALFKTRGANKSFIHTTHGVKDSK